MKFHSTPPVNSGVDFGDLDLIRLLLDRFDHLNQLFAGDLKILGIWMTLATLEIWLTSKSACSDCHRCHHPPHPVATRGRSSCGSALLYSATAASKQAM